MLWAVSQPSSDSPAPHLLLTRLSPLLQTLKSGIEEVIMWLKRLGDNCINTEGGRGPRELQITIPAQVGGLDVCGRSGRDAGAQAAIR